MIIDFIIIKWKNEFFYYYSRSLIKSGMTEHLFFVIPVLTSLWQGDMVIMFLFVIPALVRLWRKSGNPVAIISPFTRGRLRGGLTSPAVALAKAGPSPYQGEVRWGLGFTLLLNRPSSHSRSYCHSCHRAIFFYYFYNRQNFNCFTQSINLNFIRFLHSCIYRI